jgi:hypothetical protein
MWRKIQLFNCDAELSETYHLERVQDVQTMPGGIQRPVKPAISSTKYFLPGMRTFNVVSFSGESAYLLGKTRKGVFYIYSDGTSQETSG